MKKKTMMIIIYAILALIIETALGYIRKNTSILFPMSIFSGFTLMLLVPIFLSKLTIEKYKTLPSAVFTITISVVFGIFVIWDFSNLIFSIPDMVFNLLGAFSAWVFLKFGNKIKYILPLVLGIVSVYLSFFGGFQMYAHKIQYDSFTGTSEKEYRLYEIENILDNKDDLFVFYVYNNDMTNIWHNFKDFKNLYLKYKTQDSINIKLLITSDENKELIFSLQENSLPYIIIDYPKAAKEFGLNKYAATLVLRNNEVLFIGSSKKADKIISQQIE